MLDWISGLTSALRSAGEVIYGEYLAWLYRTVFGAIAEFFTQMSGMGTELFDLSWVKAALDFFRLFGWGLYTVGIAVAVFDFAIEYQCCGRANIKTTLLNILKGFFAASLFTRLPVELYRFTVTLQNTFTHDLIGTASGNVLELAREVLYRYSPNGVNALNGFGLLELLFLIALGYCVIKVFFSNIKRGGILLTQIAVGSLYLFSLPRGYADGFTQWCKQVVALCLTTFMQTTLLFLGLMTWKNNILLGFGVMLAANEVPRIAQVFGLDTGVKVNMTSVMHTTTTAVNLTKTLTKK